MSRVDDLARQANTLAEKLRRARAAHGRGGAPDTGELAAMESRLTSLWAAIRAARATGGAPHGEPDRRAQPKWG
jgi:hypothetical protein